MKKFHLRLPSDPRPVALATLVGGVAFIVLERWLKNRPTSDTLTWKVALVIGGGQLIAAAFPGASRSGTTILLALAVGLSRPAATEFSFLLGIPTLLAAGAKETWDVVKEGTPHEPWSLVILGTVISAITAFFAVKWLLGYIRHHTFTSFGWYRVIVGALILLLTN